MENTVALEKLSQTEYADFIGTQARVFFTQLPSYADVRAGEGFEVHYLGMRGDDGALRAATIALLQPWKRFFRRVVIPYGPILEWDDDAALHDFFQSLRDFYHKDWRVLTVRVNPLVSRHFYHDIDIVGENPQVSVLEREIQAVGGFLLDADSTEIHDVQERFAFVKGVGGMDFAQVMASCGQAVRTGFNRCGTNGVRIDFKKPDDIGILRDVLHHTAGRTDMHEFKDSTIAYYRDLMTRMGPEEAFLPVAILDCTEALRLIDEETQELTKKIAEITSQETELLTQSRTLSKKQRNARKEYEERLKVLEKRREETLTIQSESGDEVILAASLFIHSPHELIYLVSGAYSQYQSYYGIYLIHRAMLEWAVTHDVQWYNMFGITGDFTESASDAGVLHFKRQFTGNVEEYVGTYVLPIHPHLAHTLKALT